jgi:hypothetical protein
MFQMETATIKKTKLIHYVDFLHTTYHFRDEGTHESEQKHFSKHIAPGCDSVHHFNSAVKLWFPRVAVP